ncbi:DUF3083 family protein [Thalassomonas haliotis]|uniref:DUF3083 family protein n=1 Tax=Thalassomonas haliotis TaxID=485448 RepID=A0ABY7VK50_9GAMM|nr:DUF3083 family protein [Thalassomonas haliotis]WDE13833.1 DUF3083 family protein [Thalassomonas haliotis]
MSILRKRSAQHKVYIPSSVRENQYLLAKFDITDELLARFSSVIDLSCRQPYLRFYEIISGLFFNINNELDLESGKFVANDKFTRVRYSQEKVTAQTDQQILFLYNSQYHTGQNAYYDGEQRAKKITLVFLANGDDIRLDAAKFHQKVKKAINEFSDQLGLKGKDVRICDHQHLTYDLFAKEKGISGIQAHKLRSMTDRYAADGYYLEENIDELTYAIVDLPVNRRLKQLAAIDELVAQPYQPLYELVESAFIAAAKRYQLSHGAMVANGLIPIVRRSEQQVVLENGELQMLGYNPAHAASGFTGIWSGNKLTDCIQFVFVASVHDNTGYGYGKFLSQVEYALAAMAEQLEYVYQKEELLVRFHQHIGFYPA